MKYLPSDVIISDGEQGQFELSFYNKLTSFIEILNNPAQSNHTPTVNTLVAELDNLLNTMPASNAKAFFTRQYAELKKVRNLYG